MAGRHDGALPSPELQYAHDPPLELPGPAKPTFGVVEDAAVAQEGAPLWRGGDFAERGHAVLAGHEPPSGCGPLPTPQLPFFDGPTQRARPREARAGPMVAGCPRPRQSPPRPP